MFRSVLVALVAPVVPVGTAVVPAQELAPSPEPGPGSLVVNRVIVRVAGAWAFASNRDLSRARGGRAISTRPISAILMATSCRLPAGYHTRDRSGPSRTSSPSQFLVQ